MIEQIATVTRIELGRVWVRANNGSACGGCMQKDACGTAALGQALPERELAINCLLDLAVGDQVKVAIADDQLLLTTLLIYGLPLLVTLLLSTLLNQLPAVSEYLPEIALIILLGTFRLIHYLQAKSWLKPNPQPCILGRI